MGNGIKDIQLAGEFDALKCCVIIPTYNNEKSLAQVIADVKRYTSNIIVVNDGSTDSTAKILSEVDGIEIVSYPANKGKGYAIRQGFKKALELDYHYAVTMDSDGQHYASDLATFIQAVKEDPNSLFIGSRFMEGKDQPKSSGFANKFSNFWFWVETGLKLPDTQSGYRLYPIRAMEKKKWFCNKYEFEIEVIVRAAWKGIKVACVPIDVYYPSQEERVTHFRPFKDFFRITVLNTILVTLAFLIHRPRMIFREFKGKSLKEIYITYVKNANETKGKIAGAIGFGVFMGIFPIWGYQLLIGFLLAHLFKLNKAIFFIAANISLPPMIPFILYLSYVTGSYLMGQGSWKVDADLDIASISANIKQYIIGAIGLSFIMGSAFYVCSYLIISLFKSLKKQNA
ncbi:DUF2062 domain-containing protein [Plebeiibacterium marinum]|uniref:DUF2062 domain-containing protein n=1 Tax=Plebeiibacterium marinum TaxID=2992111 RepID=A0AAE3MEN2_9BACT|nr:DUF2062 domain-containing protein [Plebeiobacterium marinum]MCW3806056.1 DUF2062 domain-containing protein [Plebeiobacterium marinum]